MIKITNTDVWGFEGAIRGMRMPYESFDKSDSKRATDTDFGDSNCPFAGICQIEDCYDCTQLAIGEADMALAKKLIKGGSEHRKFLRMIHVQADVTAPRFWWSEADTYKWITKNSSSTMHLITKRHLTEEDFSIDPWKSEIDSRWLANIIKYYLNPSIDEYNNSKDDKDRREYWFRKIKQLLPESFNQLRTIDTNYECLLSIYNQRKNHRLAEWREFCSWVESLPYMEDFLNAMD